MASQPECRCPVLARVRGLVGAGCFWRGADINVRVLMRTMLQEVLDAVDEHTMDFMVSQLVAARDRVIAAVAHLQVVNGSAPFPNFAFLVKVGRTRLSCTGLALGDKPCLSVCLSVCPPALSARGCRSVLAVNLCAPGGARPARRSIPAAEQPEAKRRSATGMTPCIVDRCTAPSGCPQH
jgi:hypothetical protein